jgi:hypothetical protein
VEAEAEATVEEVATAVEDAINAFPPSVVSSRFFVGYATDLSLR